MVNYSVSEKMGCSTYVQVMCPEMWMSVTLLQGESLPLWGERKWGHVKNHSVSKIMTKDPVSLQ